MRSGNQPEPEHNDKNRNNHLPFNGCRSWRFIIGLVHLKPHKNMILKALTRTQRALIRAGNPYMTDSGLAQLRAARKGRRLTTGEDGRYYLGFCRRGVLANSDPLRVHIRQRVFKVPSALIVAESLRQLVQGIADTGNRPAKVMLLAMDSGIYHGDLVGNHYAYREKAGMISYCPAGRVQAIGENGRWERAGRQETTPARWIRSVLKEARIKTFRDHELAEFTEKFRAEELRGAVELVEMTDFVGAYKSTNYSTTDDGLYSCMWDDPVQHFYSVAPCKVLIAKRGDNKYMGRAIIWDDVTGTGGARFMDRVYSANPEIREMYNNYAREHGIWKKLKESAFCRTWLKPDGSTVHKTLTVEVPDLENVDFYPYMDTFSHSSGDTMTTAGGEDQDYSHLNTNGDREELNPHAGQVQTDSGDWIAEDDAYEIGGSWYHSDDVVICHHSGDAILLTDAYEVQLSRTNSVYIHEDYVNRA